MLSDYHDLLILDLVKNSPLSIKEELEQLQVRVVQARSEGDALSLFDNLTKPFVFVYTGSNQELSFKTVKGLIKNTKFHRGALVAYGGGISAFHDLLNRHFVAAVTLDLPCEVEDVSDAVQAISARYDAFLKRWQAKDQQQTDVDTLSLADFGGDRTVSSESGEGDLLERLISSGRVTLGGATYRSGGDLAFWKKQAELYPKDVEIRHQVELLMKHAGDYGSLHLHRTAYVTKALTDFLKINDSLVDVARGAAFLFATGIVEQNRELLRGDYLNPNLDVTSEQLGEMVKRGLNSLGDKIELNFMAEVILALGKYLTKEESARDDQISLVASSILASDLLDRACWGPGHWNSRGAYFFMNNLKRGELSHIHPAVLVSTKKFVSESVAAKSSAALVAREIREDPELLKLAQEAREQVAQLGEELVQIDALQPGMRLLKGLKAFDGAVIMPKDTVLDTDMIWRIWRLAAIRPINGPILVTSEEA